MTLPIASDRDDFLSAVERGDYDQAVDRYTGPFPPDLDLGTGILNVAHHPMGGGVLYRGTQLDREGLWATIAAARRKVPRARWIVRAHQHDFLHQETQDAAGVSLPCWELPTPHAKKKAYWRFQPTIGGVLMFPDPSHHLGYSFRCRFYDPPLPSVTKLGKLTRAR